MIRAPLLLSMLIVAPLSTPVLADGEVAVAGERCGASREGMLACMSGRACVCRYERGGQMTGRPDGFRWDCGALRPDCAAAPAGAPPPGMADLPPDGLSGAPPWTEPGRAR